MIPQEALDYVEFKAGTYWIIRDSSAGNDDSVVVSSSKHIMEGSSDINDCGEEYYERQFENIEVSMSGYDSVGNLIIKWVLKFNNGPKMHGSSPFDEFVINGYDMFEFGYPFDRTFHSKLYTIHEYKTDSLVTSLGTYYNILNVKAVEDGDPTSYNIKSYAKNIGLVQTVSIVHSKQSFKSYVIRYKIT